MTIFNFSNVYWFSFFLYSRLTQSQSILNPLDTPPFHDEWCDTACATRQTCVSKFGNDTLYLKLKAKYSILDGPGKHLFHGKKYGQEITRRTFDTQFVLDISNALEISPCKIYVSEVSPADNDKLSPYLDHEYVIIEFQLFDVSLSLVQELTRQVQDMSSILYQGEVTKATNRLFGIVVPLLDHSVKLMHHISMVGGNLVELLEEKQVLTHGSSRYCEDEVDLSQGSYCEFELFLRQDLANVLEMTLDNTEILRIQLKDEDSVQVFFRFIPKSTLYTYDFGWVQEKIARLQSMIEEPTSLLYNGNLTFRVDPTWGLDQETKSNRVTSSRLMRSTRLDRASDYERCRETQRCSQGWYHYNESTDVSTFTSQKFPGGEHYSIPLFEDFENWRRGSSLLQGLETNPSTKGKEPEGAYWSPVDFISLGPIIPSYNSTVNSGLVLNQNKKDADIEKQRAWIAEIQLYLVWIRKEENITSLDARMRSRLDIKDTLHVTYRQHAKILEKEKQKLKIMVQSQCNECILAFNTSNLEMNGSMNATGVIATTPDGTEVAVWTFDSIDIDNNVKVQLTGQRALALISKSSIHVDTVLAVTPGTLGGFPGGYSVKRDSIHRLVSICNEEEGNLNIRNPVCVGDQPLSNKRSNTQSTNVNGPGSPSSRIYSYGIETKAKVQNEIHKIVIDTIPGETVYGSFKLKFGDYSTPLLSHDISAQGLKAEMEDSLNPAKVNILADVDRLNLDVGIGSVTVSRSRIGINNGFQWLITFNSMVGNPEEVDSVHLEVQNFLQGDDAFVEKTTVQNGTSIGGYFTLEMFGNSTRPLPHEISADMLREAMMTDISPLIEVQATRSSKNNNCNDGYCKDGPHRSGGYTWDIILSTSQGNTSPYSPTSPDNDIVGTMDALTITNNLTGCVDGSCPEISVTRKSSTPFSLSFGGGGGSYGGLGGLGEGNFSTSMIYGDERLLNLYGGSGGALGYVSPFDVMMTQIASKSRGGSGGGAIALIAQNDIILGANSKIAVNGESGWASYMYGGGGGSGGSISLSSGGATTINGVLEAKGGNGGQPWSTGEKFVGGGGSGGRIAIFGTTTTDTLKANISINGGDCDVESKYMKKCKGSEGSLFRKTKSVLVYSTDFTTGAMDTNTSLLLHPTSDSGSVSNSKWLSGPSFKLNEPTRPQRISFFIKVSPNTKPGTQGWSTAISFGGPTANGKDAALSFSIGDKIMYGVIQKGKFFHLETARISSLDVENVMDQWYKIDFHLDWDVQKYSFYVNDILQGETKDFNLSSITHVTTKAKESNMKTWIDEIYLGTDTSMNFACPYVGADGRVYVRGGNNAVDWKPEEVGEFSTSYHEMSRHHSHLSSRSRYERQDHGGILPLDGRGHTLYTSDVKSFPVISDWHDKILKHQDTTTLLHKDGKKMKVWYGEHRNDQGYEDNHDEGGVVACSTLDLKTWKREGTMLHHVNITNMVIDSNSSLHVERPKVLYNEATETFVMWMIIDDSDRTLGMVGIATSKFYNGPFTFVRSFYPDGNRTRDFTLHKDEETGKAYLIRSFYETIEYVLPSPKMNPIWESVKDENGQTNFALNYHRAHYHPDYDNFHDIHIQRLRHEDKPWKVICINRLTQQEREIPFGSVGDDLCTGEMEYKRIEGQGDPTFEHTKDGIQSRFLDPNDPKNNVWKPNSVPSIESNTWKDNYEKGTCGIRAMDEDMQTFDPAIPPFERFDRSNCSNIADNTLHATSPDDLSGIPVIVEKRRAKYVSMSLLTDDYLETTGIFTTIEGELSDGKDLSFLTDELKSALF